MLVLYGRRRLGKTYLLRRFLAELDSEGGRCYLLADESTPERQRLALAERLLETFPSPGTVPTEIAVSWNALLRYFSSRASELGRAGQSVLVLDEFPYLVAQSPELPSVVQAWWDGEGSRCPVLVVLCGSHLATMAALGGESAPLFGRFDGGVLRLEPMRYHDVAEFYGDAPVYGVREKLLMYGALGGTPRYHAMADPELPWHETIVDLMMRPGSPLGSEARFLLSSEQIRDPAPYNAVLGAIARGKTRHGEIGLAAGLETTALARPLRVLQELAWVTRETPFSEDSERRAIYRIADPFLLFWYRFVAPLASALQFDEPARVFRERVEPQLADYMGWNVFEEVCGQWLKWRAREELGLAIQGMGRYWSRDGRIEIDVMAELEGGRRLYGECKWSEHREVGVGTYVDLRAKVAALPEERPVEYVLFSLGGFTAELHALATSNPHLHLAPGDRLLPAPS